MTALGPFSTASAGFGCGCLLFSESDVLTAWQRNDAKDHEETFHWVPHT
jgi:hypothetical protein